MIKGIVFDLDGVILSTDDFHYQAWSALAQRLGIPFSREKNNRLRGVSRMASLEIVLEGHSYSNEEKASFAEEKNATYRDLLSSLTPEAIDPEVLATLAALRNQGLRLAIGSSSKNTKLILSRVGLLTFFDAIADGSDITRSKPDPEVFLLAAERLGLDPKECVVVEDALAGIDAAIAGGFLPVAIGDATKHRGAKRVLSAFGDLLHLPELKHRAFAFSSQVKEVGEIAMNMYHQGWDERNGGNISVMVEESVVDFYFAEKEILRTIPLGFVADPVLRGKHFLVTGTGKYFKNILNHPETHLGLIQISASGEEALLLWGYEDGGRMTSEFPAHLMSHAVRYKADPSHRVIMHTHPTYTICMGATLPTDDIVFTRKLWKSNTEAVVVFPEGIGVLPCMVCGTNLIGEATAEKMKTHRLVSWTNHGIYGSGKDIDEAFGLIETVEKTAEIYMITLGHVVNEIPDEVVLGLAKLWHLDILPGVIEEHA